MASRTEEDVSGIVSEVIRSIQECQLCKKVSSDSRTLPCLHYLCNGCYRSLVRPHMDDAVLGKMVMTVQCPTCGMQCDETEMKSLYAKTITAGYVNSLNAIEQTQLPAEKRLQLVETLMKGYAENETDAIWLNESRAKLAAAKIQITQHYESLKAKLDNEKNLLMNRVDLLEDIILARHDMRSIKMNDKMQKMHKDVSLDNPDIAVLSLMRKLKDQETAFADGPLSKPSYVITATFHPYKELSLGSLTVCQPLLGHDNYHNNEAKLKNSSVVLIYKDVDTTIQWITYTKNGMCAVFSSDQLLLFDDCIVKVFTLGGTLEKETIHNAENYPSLVAAESALPATKEIFLLESGGKRLLVKHSAEKLPVDLIHFVNCKPQCMCVTPGHGLLLAGDVNELSWTNGVVVLDRNRKEIQRWECKDTPTGIAVSKDWHIFLVMHHSHEIVVYTQSGDLLKTFGTSSSLYSPHGICMTPRGNLLISHQIAPEVSKKHPSRANDHLVSLWTAQGNMVKTVMWVSSQIKSMSMHKDGTLAVVCHEGMIVINVKDADFVK